MFKKPTKRQFIIRRVILSTVATFSVIILATAAILFMLGYRLDSGKGRLEQGALLQLNSIPGGADVYVDGTSIGSRTSTKHTVVAGEHAIRMSRDGYQDWNRTLTLSAGTLTWLDYARLVPKERPVQTVATYETLASMKTSPDNKWALLHEKTDAPEFQLADLRAQEVKVTELIMPAAVYTEAETPDIAHSFMPVSWDSGARYVLVKHLYKDQTEWIVLDTQNVAQTVNITKIFNTGFNDVQFASTSGKVLYGLTNDGTIRKIDLSAETLSRAFVTHVESFSVYDKTLISYIGQNPANASQRVAGVYRDGDEAGHIIRSSSSPDTIFKIAISRYYNDDFVAIAEGSLVTILKGAYPTSSAQDTSSLKTFATFQLTGAVSSLSFSPAASYVVAQSGETFTSYEIEHKRSATDRIVPAEGQAVSALKWLDVAHLWNDDAGTLMMRDFNGVNKYAIMSVAPGFDASLSQNGRYFYAIGKDDKGFHLQRVRMVLS